MLKHSIMAEPVNLRQTHQLHYMPSELVARPPQSFRGKYYLTASDLPNIDKSLSVAYGLTLACLKPMKGSGIIFSSIRASGRIPLQHKRDAYQAYQ